MRRTSPSAIQKHDACPRKWWFEYVEGIKEPSTPAMALGTEVHSRIEHYLRSGQDVLGPMERPALEKGLIPRPGPGLLIEHDFTLPTSAGFPVTGRIDLIDTRGGAARWRVVDWKTKSSIDKYGSSPRDLIDTSKAQGVQMLIYGAVVAAMRDAPLELVLSHVEIQTKGRHQVVEVQQPIAMDWAVNLWRQVERRLPVLQETASKATYSEVAGNKNACHSYGRACIHLQKCFPSPGEQLAVALRSSMGKGSIGSGTATSIGSQGGNKMPLLSRSSTPVAQEVQPPVIQYLPPDQPALEKPVGGDAEKAKQIEKARVLLSPSKAEAPAPAKKRGRPAKQPTGMDEGDIPPPPPDSPLGRAIASQTASQTVTVPAATATAPSAVHIYVGCLPTGAGCVPLLSYVDQCQDAILRPFRDAEEKGGDAAPLDIRCAQGNDNPLAYSKWKGFLSAVVRGNVADGFAPGNYFVADESDERVKVVLGELEARLPAGSVIRRVG